MSSELAPVETRVPSRRRLRLELVLAVLVATVVLLPGIGRYTLLDPWETHYGEVAREMLEHHDFVHTKWRGTFYSRPGDNEGFRSKPVLMFWLMAAGLRALGVGEAGGYSGEMVQDARTMIGIRLPFVLCAIAGLTLMWWMLAKLVDRRLAWLALLVVGSTPMFCMMSRQGIPDMPMVACTMGAFALLALALEDGARPTRAFAHLLRGRVALDARHVVLGIAGALIAVQAIYLAGYFAQSPALAIRMQLPSPALWLPVLTLALFGALARDGWLVLRLPFVLVGGVIAAIANEPLPRRRAGQALWRHVFDDILGVWDRHALDKLVFRASLGLACAVVVVRRRRLPMSRGELWSAAGTITERVFGLAKLTTMRQVYLLAGYFLLGVSLLAKGPPGFTVIVGVAAFHVILCWQWRTLWDGGFELKRGLLLIAAVAVPWHLAMYFKDGVQFIEQYIFQHILNRAGDGSVDKSLGTFAHYTSQIGPGMWLWAALLPVALGAMFLRSTRETREGRVRFLVALWAIAAVFVFAFVQTKFNHYILPAIPPLGLIVAFYLHDLVARRERLHPIAAALGVGIVLLICRDLMFEPERWVEMFVYRDDRAWPAAEPWQIDPSDGILALGIAAAIGIAITSTRFVRTGVAVLGGVGLAICIWALQVYMPHAGTHWGMRAAARTYYEQRTIYGQQRRFFGGQQCLDHLRAIDRTGTWRFESFVPDGLQVGQPMTLALELRKAAEDTAVEHALALEGEVTAVGHHDITVTLRPAARPQLEVLRAACERRANEPAPRRPPIVAVDADRLIAWQLYWRGENFWSGGEIWGWLPEQKTSFVPTDNTALLKYLNDRTLAPLGRRYFVLTDSGRSTAIKSLLPTARARETYEVLDTTSNKFSIAAFYL